MLAQINHKRHSSSYPHLNQQHHQRQPYPSSASKTTTTTTTTTYTPINIPQRWTQSIQQLSPPHSQYNNNATTTTNNHLFSFGADQPLFDFQDQSESQSPMQSEHNNSWLSNGQLTPTSTTRAHHRESSFSSLGSAGPASPYTANTSNPQVAGEYHDFNDFAQTSSSKPLTPAHTPSQDQFLTPHYTNFYPNLNNSFGMSNDVLPKGDAELMPAPDFNHSGQPSIASVASHDSPSTPPSYEEERQKIGYRNGPKLSRTLTDMYADELYNPNLTYSISATPTTTAPTVMISPQADVFTQRLQAANNQHLNANIRTPLAIPSRERSPFRQGSPLAPTGNNFGSHQSQNLRFGTATHMREQAKADSDAQALQQQMARQTPEHATPKTISPKDVDMVYQENEDDANTPLFPPQQQHQSLKYHPQQPTLPQEPTEDDNISQQSYGSMATTRRESSSAFSTTSQPQANSFSFTAPSVPRNMKLPQHYPFVPKPRRQPSNLSENTEDFHPTLTSMESSSSEYAPDSTEIKRPSATSADSGTYTCTYHGCSLRFDTPAKLQRHKREGHRNSTSVIGGGDEGGMTSAAQRNSQAGPHKCERINPSTGKPCNTIFSRPYDLTRHEDTIHNARKQKVHCPYCTEEKTFSRNDALTRHLRVVHPNHADVSTRRRRGGS